MDRNDLWDGVLGLALDMGTALGTDPACHSMVLALALPDSAAEVFFSFV
jgi:hypothetical protein